MTRNAADLNVRYALRTLRRRLALFVLCAVLVPAIAVIASLLQTKQYTATAQLLFRDPQYAQMLFGASINPSDADPARQAATNLGLVSLPRVAALTATRLHMTKDQVLADVSQSNSGQSDLVFISAVAGDPASAQRLANTFASEYIALRRHADRSTISAAEQPLRSQIADLPSQLRNGGLGQSLLSLQSRLSVLASLQTGGAELVQPAPVPTSPSSPKPVRNAALGLFFGIVLGIALVVLAEILDRRLRDPAEVEQLFESPVLATVPETPALATNGGQAHSAPGPSLEAFRMLWATLRFYTLSRDIHSVCITSSDRDDGKSTVSWGLARAAALAGERVLLIEADLRNPTFAKRFDIRRRTGLSDVLVGDASLEDAIVHHDLAGSAGFSPDSLALDVLISGRRPPNPSDLLQLSRMGDVLSQATERYTFVVVDTPPLTVVSDAIPLVPLVDGLIVVARLANTLRDHALRLRRQLHHLDAPTIGIVINADVTERYEAYGYGYDEQDTSPPARRRNGAAPARDQSRTSLR